MSLCESIDTLSMAYLDDELAGEERRELELHLTECNACRAHLDGERADHELIQRALVAPPAPDLLRARIARALDGEDHAAARAGRKRWTQWVLPGSAILAAAAAIAVFVGVKPVGPRDVGTVAAEAVRQAARPMPFEVQGPGTNQWAIQHAAAVVPPQFTEPSVQRLGARLGTVNGHDAVRFEDRVDTARGSFVLTSIVMVGVQDDELAGGETIDAGRHQLHLISTPTGPAVTYVDGQHRGYMFYAPALTPEELVDLVSSAIRDR